MDIPVELQESLRLRGIQVTDLLTWNTLEPGMQVVLAGGAVWDVTQADTRTVTVRNGEREVTRNLRDLRGVPLVVKSQELSRIMKARIANAEQLLHDMLGAERANLGLPPKPPGHQGFVCSTVFTSVENLASHLYMLHGEWVKGGKGWDADPHGMLEWHNELHDDTKPSDFPWRVPHVHWDRPKS